MDARSRGWKQLAEWRRYAVLMAPLGVALLSVALAGVLRAQDGWHVAFAAQRPSARSAHAMAFDPVAGQVLVFGGADPFRRNDTWRWTGTTWTLVATPVAPSQRAHAAAATDSLRRQIVLFGGDALGGLSDETWIWNGTQWIRRTPSHSPSPRHAAQMAFDESRGLVVLMGGLALSGQVLTDTWEWDGNDWQERSPANQPPTPTWSQMVFDVVGREHVVLYAARADSGVNVSETWEWDGADWHRLLPAATSPSMRRGFGFSFDRRGGRGVLFGGRASDQSLRDDTWEWHVDRWIERARAPRPSPREFHAMAYDPVRGESVLFGGQSLGLLAETWIHRFEITEPASLDRLGVGCAGGNGIPLLTAADGRGPWIGESAKLVLSNLPAALFAPAFGILGTAQGFWGGSSIPVELGGLGAPGCILQVAPLDAILLPRTATGEAVWRVPVPNVAALIGLEFALQGLAFDLLANSLGIVLSNGLLGHVGRR